MKRFATYFFGFLTLFLCDSDAAARQYALQFGASVAADGNHVFVGEGRNLLQPGKVIIYSIGEDGSWSESGRLSPSAVNDGDGFGRAMDASHGRLAVAAPDDQLVYIYDRAADGAWQLTTQVSNNTPGFGAEVAVDGDHLIVAASGDRDTERAVFSFLRTEMGEWEPGGELSVENDDARDGFGSAIDVQGRTAFVGAPNADSRRGRVHVFEFDGMSNSWDAASSLEYPLPTEGDRFGSTILAALPHVAVGLPGRDRRTGAVAIFKQQNNGTYAFDRRIAPFDARGNEQFGASMALAGGELLIGAPGYGDSEGALYRFELDMKAGRSESVSLLAPSMRQYRGAFAGSIAASGNVGVIGARGHDNFEGAAFPFQITGGSFHLGRTVYSDSGVFHSVTGSEVSCEDSGAAGFPCEDVDMLSFLSRSDIGARRGIQVSDVWGWEDPATGKEYALIGRTDGTSFVDMTNPNNPIYLGNLQHTDGSNQSLWRDIKTYRNHAYIVADGAGAHHMQVFDLTQLRDVAEPPVEFEETSIYEGIYSSHNVIINEDTGFAYAVGSDSGGETCGGALHMIDLSDPAKPSFAGCFSDTRTGRGGSGATHDAQCVLYHGPDADYSGREICLSSNGTALSIADVTDKADPVAVSFADYPNVAYAHQGWLTEDHRYFYLNDEGDEGAGLTDGTRTLIFDLTDLDEPELAGEYVADHNAIDHNLYVKDNLMYQTNYVAGLRIMDISDPVNPVEVAHFDTVPYGPNDNSPVLGAWSNYPYFKSGVIVVTSGREGVFFLRKKEIDI